MTRLIPALFLSIGLIAAASAAVEVSARISGFADNREYHSDGRTAQTFYGGRGAATVSQEFGDYHVMGGGLAYSKDFGNNVWHAPEPILYYQFHTERTMFRMGAFTRRDLISIPECLLSDSFSIARPNLEGAFLSRGNGRFVRSAWLDWTGARADSVRESFLLGMASSWDGDHISINGDLLYRHIARSDLPSSPESIIDNAGARLGVSVPIHVPCMDSLTLTAAALAMAHRDRGEGSSWNTPLTASLGFDMSKGRLGVALTYNRCLSPDEGPIAALLGDPLYGHSESLSGDLYCRFLSSGPVSMRFDLFIDGVDHEIDVRQRFLLEAQIGYRHKPAAGENASSWFGIIER